MYPLTHLLLTEIYFQKYEKGLNKELSENSWSYAYSGSIIPDIQNHLIKVFEPGFNGTNRLQTHINVIIDVSNLAGDIDVILGESMLLHTAIDGETKKIFNKYADRLNLSDRRPDRNLFKSAIECYVWDYYSTLMDEYKAVKDKITGLLPRIFTKEFNTKKRVEDWYKRNEELYGYLGDDEPKKVIYKKAKILKNKPLFMEIMDYMYRKFENLNLVDAIKKCQQ